MAGGSGPTTRGTLAAALLVIAGSYVTLSSFDFLLTAIQLDLLFSTNNANSLAFAPAAASLTVVFLVGALADRWGARRVLLIAISLHAAGAVMLVLAPNFVWVALARMLDGVGGVAMGVVGLAVINASVTTGDQRARAFALFAAVQPAVFIVSPLLTAAIVEYAGWRPAALPWLIIDALAMAVTLRYVPSTRGTRRGELWTPVLAGLVLAGLALGATNFPTSRLAAATAFAISFVSLVILVVLLRVMSRPSLDLRWCRAPGVGFLIVALALAVTPNLIFFTNILLQYRYTISLTAIAALFTATSVSAVAGSLLSGPVSARMGPGKTGVFGLLLAAVVASCAVLVDRDAAVWEPLLLLSVYALCFGFVLGPLTNLFMSHAPAEVSGVASALRKATTTVGTVLGGVILGAVAFDAFRAKLTEILTADGVSVNEAQIISQQLRDGAVADDLAAQLADPVAQDAIVSRGPGLLEAQSYAFATLGLVSAVLHVIAAALVIVYLRRRAPQGIVQAK